MAAPTEFAGDDTERHRHAIYFRRECFGDKGDFHVGGAGGFEIGRGGGGGGGWARRMRGLRGERVAGVLHFGQLARRRFWRNLGVAPLGALFRLAVFPRMQSHGPKRVYTPHSLEFWFGKLEHDWSGAFTATQLEAGRQIYRDSEVRELELTDHDAIVHRRIEKKDEYAVIEWTSEGLSVRSSSTDHELAH
eukprot:gene58397-77916_t